MSIFRRKKQTDAEAESLKSFLDMIAPSIVKFETGYYICGNTFRCIWALREYPTSTDDLAILRHLGEKHGVTLHIYTRMVSPLEERKIVHNAEIRNRMNRGSSQNMSASCQPARSRICSHSTIPVKRTEKAFTSGKTSTAATS